jgi:hypothetical protein
MNNATTGDSQQIRRPIGSLISKSEKAQRKLTPGTWQHTMLRDNIKALRIALVLLERAGDEGQFQRNELRKALAAIASMIRRARKAQAGFPPGTSHHTLQKNRLKALRIAKARVKKELDKGNA